MRKTAKVFVGCLFLFVLIMASVGYANTILLSGDINFGNAIDGTWGAPVTDGNAIFLSNVLGAGNNVLIQDEYYSSSVIGQAATDAIHTYYNNLGGVTSSLYTGPITITNSLLTGVDLFFSILPSDTYQTDEITAILNFLNGGGTLFLIGDNQINFPNTNARINSVLGSLGSSMSLGGSSIGGGDDTTTNIVPNPYTAGISSFTYAWTNVVNGGNPLLRTITQETFIAYDGESTPIPEPATMLLLGTGLVGVAGAVRRRNKKRA